ncbi:MAG: SpoIIE family protein phosphatase [Firmicutes bacterium]|nr:SpoIIE family protein phosphatase [Bacillota bacterium]
MDKTGWLTWRIAKRWKRPLRVTVGMASLAGDGYVSGDSVCYGEVGRETFAVVLSDGMGNGHRAAEESGLIVRTVYQLLSANYPPELALPITNAVMLYRSAGGEEFYSTLDLALINLHSGNLQLYKTGASLTVIRRRKRLGIVRMSSLPMGVVGDLPVPSWTCHLRSGDQILLLSDGIAEAGRRENCWLTDAILDQLSSDPHSVAENLIRRAAERAGETEKDDMTAVVIVVQ